MTAVCNAMLGKVNYYAGLPGTGDALTVIPLEASGIEADTALADYTTLAALLANNTEQTTMGRKTVSATTVTADNDDDTQAADFDDLVWESATGNAIAKLVVCYNATGSDTDAQLKPLTVHDFSATPDGTNITATVSDFFSAGNS